MKWFFGSVVILVVVWMGAVAVFNSGESNDKNTLVSMDSLQAKEPLADSTQNGSTADTVKKAALLFQQGIINTKAVQPQQVVDFAKTLIGTPYLYASTNPVKGFDCSGFITYVFNHFDIAVPRSSIDFTNVGKEVSAAAAAPGDLILFTGADSSQNFVGHMGIVVSNTDTLRFIHSTSGRQHGVTITPLNSYYQGRLVKTVRVFP